MEDLNVINSFESTPEDFKHNLARVYALILSWSESSEGSSQLTSEEKLKKNVKALPSGGSVGKAIEEANPADEKEGLTHE